MRLVGLALLLGSLGCRQILGFEAATTADSTTDVPIDASLCPQTGTFCADATTLRTCGDIDGTPVDTSCSWGCIADAPHCGTLDPTGSVIGDTDVLFASSDLLDQDIPLNVTIDGQNGSISGVRGNGSGVINGISFQNKVSMGVFRFKSVAFRGTVTLTGSLPIVIISDGPLTIAGIVDVRGNCNGNNGGPGGSPGGNPNSDGQGTGRGRRGLFSSQTEVSGASGGGYGADGGDGGTGGIIAPGGSGGTGFGDPTLSTLIGGSGGGGGARAGDGGTGGGGGGAVFLISNTRVEIAANTGINAGGCGGGPATASLGSGGGGGSGGAILIEAPEVRLDGILAVNGGGGGGGGNNSMRGEHGPLAMTAAIGGVSPEGDGGAGGAGVAVVGEAGKGGTRAGGGGGGVGRIRINTRTGMIAVGPNGQISPALDAPATSATLGTATVF